MFLKSNLFRSALLLSAMTLTMTACSDKNEPDDDTDDFNSQETLTISESDLDYDDATGVWAFNDFNAFFEIEDYSFSHFVAEGDYSYIYGFTPSKASDTGYYEQMSQHSYVAMGGKGANGAGKPYIVANWSEYDETIDGAAGFDSKTCRIFETEGELFMPQSVMLNNNTYMYYSATRGDMFNAPFKKGDWVKVIAHGVHQDGSESSAEFKIVDITTDDVAAGVISEWTKFDLSGLGICTGLYFTMQSNVANEYGMTAPAYFCIDNLIIKD